MSPFYMYMLLHVTTCYLCTVHVDSLFVQLVVLCCVGCISSKNPGYVNHWEKSNATKPLIGLDKSGCTTYIAGAGVEEYVQPFWCNCVGIRDVQWQLVKSHFPYLVYIATRMVMHTHPTCLANEWQDHVGTGKGLVDCYTGTHPNASAEGNNCLVTPVSTIPCSSIQKLKPSPTRCRHLVVVHVQGVCVLVVSR